MSECYSVRYDVTRNYATVTNTVLRRIHGNSRGYMKVGVCAIGFALTQQLANEHIVSDWIQMKLTWAHNNHTN